MDNLQKNKEKPNNLCQIKEKRPNFKLVDNFATKNSIFNHQEKKGPHYSKLLF